MQGRFDMKSSYEFAAGVAAILSVAYFHFDANAYLNPGTGSMILQALIAGIAVLGVTIKLYWFKFVAFLKGEKYEAEDEDLLAGLDLDSDSDKTDS